MGKKIKKIIKNNIFGFILGALMFGTVGVLAATYCASSEVSYDNSSSGMESTDVQSAIDELYQLANSKPALDVITGLVSTNTDQLYTDDHGNIRYYGANPNNYVKFNNELWRIIGVIDGKVKIIRNESIGAYYWASNGKNNWDNSDLKSYLNGEYYNNIDDTSKNMISTNEKFYLGSPSFTDYNKLTASGYYSVERGSNVYSGNPTSTTQAIGLMYPSDYGYATGNSCSSTELYNYKNGCQNSDYLYSGVDEWLQVTYRAFSNTVIYISNNGQVTYSYYGVNGKYYAVRPVLYLTSTTKITGGTGTLSNPYILG